MLRRFLPRARALRTEVWAIALATRDPRTPRLARALGWVAVAYALSPIDLVPDFIPVLGQLDDLIVLPAIFALVLRLVPPEVMRECRQKAAIQTARVKRAAWIAAGVIVALWVLALWAIYLLLRALFHRRA